MSKQEWMRHRADVLDQAGSYAIGDERSIVREHSKGCKDCNARRRTLRANRSQRERSDAYRSLGLVKTPYGWE